MPRRSIPGWRFATGCARERAWRANSQRTPPPPYGDKPMTEQQAAAAQARLDASTPGPWEHEWYNDGEEAEITQRDFIKNNSLDELHLYFKTLTGKKRWTKETGDFIAAAPTDLALALAAIRRVREACAEERCYDKTGNPTDEAVNGVLDRILAALDGEAEGKANG